MTEKEELLGTTVEIKLPDGNTVTIREQTGEDEDTLSRLKDSRDGSAVNKFISGLIIDSSYPSTTPEAVSKMKSRVRNYILLNSRRFSLGDEITYTHTFADATKQDFDDDLADYLWDYEGKDFPLPGEDGFDPKYCMPYPDDSTHFEFEISSGKKCKMRYLTGEAEMQSLGFKESVSINSRLIVREFELENEGAWTKIERFNMFSSREMSEVRKVLKSQDPEWELLTTVTHPVSGLTEEVSLFVVEDFFFPRG